MTKSHPISLLMFAALIASMLSCCESAKPPQTIEPINETTTLDRGDTKETGVAPLTPPTTTSDIDDRDHKTIKVCLTLLVSAYMFIQKLILGTINSTKTISMTSSMEGSP